MGKSPKATIIAAKATIIAAIIAGTATIIGLIGAALINNNTKTKKTTVSEQTPISTSDAKEICKSLEILNYTDGQEVPIDINGENNKITLQGEIKLLDNKTYFLWILGKPDGSSFYYPFGRSAQIDSTGSWSSDGYTSVYKTDKEYTFIPIILSKKEKEELDSQLPENRKEKKVINEIPVSNRQICSSITVKFKPN